MIIAGIGTQGGRYFWWSMGGWVLKFKVSFKISGKGWQIYGKNTLEEVGGICLVGLSELTNRSHFAVRHFAPFCRASVQ